MREHGVSSSTVTSPRTMPRVPTGGADPRRPRSAAGRENLGVLQELAPFPELVKSAREKYQEALRIADEIKEKGRIAEIQTALANLSVEEGHPSEAETPCTKAADEFRVENNASAEIYSHIVLARALIALGRFPDAKNEVDVARNILAKSQLLTDRWNLTILGAQVQAAMGNFTAVEKSLYQSLQKPQSSASSRISSKFG
jgi:hypothetical protein